MGYSFPSNGVPLPKTLLLLLILLDLAIFAVTTVLYHLGLSPSSEAPRRPSWEDIAALLAIASPEETQPTSASVKSRLPVKKFAGVMHQKADEEGDKEEVVVEEATCVVCLARLEKRDEVRELGNCCHVFHRECLDKWVEVGRQCCPLCRSPLLPGKTTGGETVGFLGLRRKVWR